MPQFKNVLVLAPHTDDGELGAGGTISKLIEEGSNVYYVAFSTAEASVPSHLPKDILVVEVKEATKRLGILPERLIIYRHEVRKLGYVRQEILESLIKLKSDIDPNLVIMPSLTDIHQDHSTVAQEGLRAFKSTTLFGYELIWNNVNFRTSAFVELEARHLDSKIFALSAYESQAERSYMSSEFQYSMARVRGTQAGCAYAESFDVIRYFLR